ncbi:MAG: hypothetical protein HC858_04165 [Brachymonas sp.]|nr:hypothetical protein [Brachymonas sp.]
MNVLLQQLDSVLAYKEDLLKSSPCSFGDLTGVPFHDIRKGITLAIAVIERIGGQDSPYAKQVKNIEIQTQQFDLQFMAMELFGVVEALRSDVASGYLLSVKELIHGELFTDFLDMAEHLLNEGYKDASAVIAGSSLEAHLKKLCVKHSISLTTASSSGSKPKKADGINADLAIAQAYSKLDQKNVVAWLGLRNSAAHGDYHCYTNDQVKNFISGVRDFVKRTPA